MSMGMPSWPGPVMVSPLFVPGASINVECGKRAERTLIDGMVQVGSGGFSRIQQEDDPVAWPQVHAINYGHFQVHTDRVVWSFQLQFHIARCTRQTNSSEITKPE